MNDETKTTLLAMARFTLAMPGMGTDLAQAVIAALAPPSRTPGRVWKVGEACPIVAKGQKRTLQDNTGPVVYTVGESGVFLRHDIQAGDNRYRWLNNDIVRDLLAEDWIEQ